MIKRIFIQSTALPEKGVVHESNCLGIKLVLGSHKPPPFWRAHILKQSAGHFFPGHIRFRTIDQKRFFVYNGALPVRSHSKMQRKKRQQIFTRKRNRAEKVTESVVGSALFLIEWERYLRNGTEKVIESVVGSALFLIEWRR